MFFIFSKVLTFAIAPITWVIIFLVLAMIIAKKRRKFLIWSFSVFFVFGNSFLLDEALRQYEVNRVNKTELGKYEAVIILGGYSNYDPTNNQINFGESSDRFIYGLWCYKNKVADKIIISGGSASLLGLDKEGSYVYPFLTQLGVKAKDILVDSISQNTYQNAVNVKQIVEQNNIEGRILLITSSVHMLRASKCFNKQGIEVVQFPVDRISGSRKFHLEHLILPQAETLQKQLSQ